MLENENKCNMLALSLHTGEKMVIERIDGPPLVANGIGHVNIYSDELNYFTLEDGYVRVLYDNVKRIIISGEHLFCVLHDGYLDCPDYLDRFASHVLKSLIEIFDECPYEIKATAVKFDLSKEYVSKRVLSGANWPNLEMNIIGMEGWVSKIEEDGFRFQRVEIDLGDRPGHPCHISEALRSFLDRFKK